MSETVPVYPLPGEIDAESAERHFAELSALVAATDAESVVVDLADTRMVDTTGMGMLIRVQTECRARGKRLVLRSADNRLVRIMQIAGTYELFDWLP